MRIWLQTSGVDARSAAAVTERLGYLGVEVVAQTPPADKLPGILLVDSLGCELAARVRELNPNGLGRLIVIALRAADVAEPSAFDVIAAGASDVLAWDDPDACAEAVRDRTRRWAEVEALVDSPLVTAHLAGASPAWRSVLRQIVEVAAFTNASILLLGENGTGKEEVARLVHALDRRASKRDFVTLDCSTVAADLAGSEFFGHERGAFTSAVSARDGAFALAHQGTLFLDEVGELPSALQAQLLRVVQEGTFKRVGGTQWLRTEMRIVSATNRDLHEEVAGHRFRRDLFHRLATWIFRLPPLRERAEDILALAEHFARQEVAIDGDAAFEPAVRDLLMRRQYPGNVRELRQLVIRLAGRHVGRRPIGVGDVPLEELPIGALGTERELELAIGRAVRMGLGLQEIKRVTRESAIRTALDLNANSVQQAARLLKTTDRALQMELKKRDA